MNTEVGSVPFPLLAAVGAKTRKIENPHYMAEDPALRTRIAFVIVRNCAAFDMAAEKVRARVALKLSRILSKRVANRRNCLRWAKGILVVRPPRERPRAASEALFSC